MYICIHTYIGCPVAEQDEGQDATKSRRRHKYRYNNNKVQQFCVSNQIINKYMS